MLNFSPDIHLVLFPADFRLEDYFLSLFAFESAYDNISSKSRTKLMKNKANEP